MGHVVGRCDFLDLLEESAVLRAPVDVELRDGRAFADVVRAVETRDGQDLVVFRDHGQMAVDEIRWCGRGGTMNRTA